MTTLLFMFAALKPTHPELQRVTTRTGLLITNKALAPLFI
jgi:hypothetical protein